MKDQAADKRSPIIAGALILTAVFLGVFGWLLVSTPMPSDCPSGLWFFDRLACLGPNELGDTFAGAFAPVAFVWLVAAVMLQRNELAAQRQELREARAVAEAQVAEARNNVAYMAQQTQMLQAREVVERRKILDDDFISHVEAVSGFIETAFDIIKVSSEGLDGWGNEINSDLVVLERSIDLDVFKRLQFYSMRLSSCSVEAFRANEIGRVVQYFGVEEIKSISDHLEVLRKKSEEISAPLQIRFQNVKADEAIWRIGLLVDLLNQKGALIPEIDF
jgi:hypothetical protein